MPDHADAGTRFFTESRPQRRAPVAMLAGLLAVVLSGCAATTTTESASEAQPPPLLRQLAAGLPGEYVSVRETDGSAQRLRIDARAGSKARSVGLLMIQSDRDGSNERRYGLQLEPTEVDNRLAGRFAILDRNGQARRSCTMRFHVTSQGLVGQTDPESCQFGEGEESVGVLKEMAIQGRRLTIADRLVDPASGNSLGTDQVIRFLPAVAFSGWLGVREGGDWRVAQDFSLRIGDRVEPLDAADMSLGVAVSLDYYRMERASATTMLRLTATDIETGEVVAESWAEPGSGSIGLALPKLQIGLQNAD